MAARRGKTQARRNHGNNGLPGWAWMVLGIVLTLVAILMGPKLLKSEGDGFFRPQPNPDARPAPVATSDDELIAPTPRAHSERAASGTGAAATAPATGPQYDFYTLLPGKEVPVSDAELAATARGEAERLAAQQRAEAVAAARNEDAADPALPRPVAVEGETPVAPTATPATRTPATVTAAPPATGHTGAAGTTSPTATASVIAGASTAAGAGDGSRYLLQAGAFQASGQAEELKARIAMLGLGARVESAQINGKTVYRVRMGPYGTASDLADAKRKLADGGLQAMAIKVQ